MTSAAISPAGPPPMIATEIFMRSLYNTHGHKLRFPSSKKAQFVTALGIIYCVLKKDAFARERPLIC
jgi:hypothetical protein